MTDSNIKEQLSIWWLTYGDNFVSWLDNGVASTFPSTFFGKRESGDYAFEPCDYFDAEYDSGTTTWRFKLNEYGKQLIGE